MPSLQQYGRYRTVSYCSQLRMSSGNEYRPAAAVAFLVTAFLISEAIMACDVSNAAAVAPAPAPAPSSLMHPELLTTNFYAVSCPNITGIVEDVVSKAIVYDRRMAGSLLRLHFHDCFVNGCDGSLLLDDTPTTLGEKNVAPNNNSVTGFDVIDQVKTALEAACPATVSCADLLAYVANASVVLVGGPSWNVQGGRRDTRTVNSSAPAQFLPGPTMTLSQQTTTFGNLGFTLEDMVTLSGGHTIGRSRCLHFMSRLYNFNGTGSPDPTMDKAYVQMLQSSWPPNGDPNTYTWLDITTPTIFDNGYYLSLLKNRGLLFSDQTLLSSTQYPLANTTSALVQTYAANQTAFFEAFASSMIKMGSLSPLTGALGEIRLDCRKIN